MADERSSSDGDRDRKLEGGNATTSPPAATPPKPGLELHAAFYIGLWIVLSSAVIIFNKWVLSTAKFDFPMFLTTWHMVFASITTQLMARYTTLLDSRLKVPMTTETYRRAIIPIGLFSSLSLICGNLTYLYLSVSFIQMLKATNAVATLVATWIFGMAQPNLRELGNVSIIVIGVVIASFGEIKFDFLGFIYQVGGVIFEALRLVLVQQLLSSPDFKMDPLVSLYYYAPACAVINGVLTALVEGPRLTLNDISTVGMPILFSNAFVAFLLNVSIVLLIGKTSAVVFTMSGVLKDILLVFASMIIFGDPVTGQQAFGYGIALVGLIYYKLGAEKVQSLTATTMLQIGEVRHNHPRLVRSTMLGSIVILAICVWLWGSSALMNSAGQLVVPAKPEANANANPAV